MTDLTNKRVVILVRIMLIVVPLLDVADLDLNDNGSSVYFGLQ